MLTNLRRAARGSFIFGVTKLRGKTYTAIVIVEQNDRVEVEVESMDESRIGAAFLFFVR